MTSSVNYDQFSALDIRVATIKAVENIEGADRLYKITLDAGELGERTVAAGIKAFYQPEELIGRQVVYLANLEARLLKGVESQGMLLAADSGEAAVLLQPAATVPDGSKVR
jgi:methionyl-tRNA synthetase